MMKVFTVVVFLVPIVYTVSSLPRHPILMEIPFLRSEGWPFYYIVLVIHIAIMWMGCNLVLGTEFLPFFFIQYVNCRIEILAHMIKHWNDNLKHNHHKIEARKNDLSLKQIVQYHSSIKQNMADINQIFSPMLMVTLMTNSLVICMCLFIISEVL